MQKFRKKEDKWNGFVAGSVAGISLFAETAERRIAFSQQFLMRGLQSLFNGFSKRGIFNVSFGDTLIFMLGSAHIMVII
jgi:hypothetical protein